MIMRRCRSRRRLAGKILVYLVTGFLEIHKAQTPSLGALITTATLEVLSHNTSSSSSSSSVLHLTCFHVRDQELTKEQCCMELSRLVEASCRSSSSSSSASISSSDLMDGGSTSSMIMGPPFPPQQQLVVGEVNGVNNNNNNNNHDTYDVQESHNLENSFLQQHSSCTLIPPRDINNNGNDNENDNDNDNDNDRQKSRMLLFEKQCQQEIAVVPETSQYDDRIPVPYLYLGLENNSNNNYYNNNNPKNNKMQQQQRQQQIHLEERDKEINEDNNGNINHEYNNNDDSEDGSFSSSWSSSSSSQPPKPKYLQYIFADIVGGGEVKVYHDASSPFHLSETLLDSHYNVDTEEERLTLGFSSKISSEGGMHRNFHHTIDLSSSPPQQQQQQANAQVVQAQLLSSLQQGQAQAQAQNTQQEPQAQTQSAQPELEQDSHKVVFENGTMVLLLPLSPGIFMDMDDPYGTSEGNNPCRVIMDDQDDEEVAAVINNDDKNGNENDAVICHVEVLNNGQQQQQQTAVTAATTTTMMNVIDIEQPAFVNPQQHVVAFRISFHRRKITMPNDNTTLATSHPNTTAATTATTTATNSKRAFPKRIELDTMLHTRYPRPRRTESEPEYVRVHVPAPILASGVFSTIITTTTTTATTSTTTTTTTITTTTTDPNDNVTTTVSPQKRRLIKLAPIRSSSGSSGEKKKKKKKNHYYYSQHNNNMVPKTTNNRHNNNDEKITTSSSSSTDGFYIEVAVGNDQDYWSVVSLTILCSVLGSLMMLRDISKVSKWQ